MWPRPSHPRAAARRQPRPVATGWCVRTRLHCAQAFGRRLPEGARPQAGRRLQIVDGLDPVELPLDAIELAAKLSDGASVARPIPIELREDLPTRFHGRLVLESPRLVEERGDLLLRHVSHPVNVQQGCLATERLNLLQQPLKELGSFCRLRKDPGRSPEPNGPHALELPPN